MDDLTIELDETDFEEAKRAPKGNGKVESKADPDPDVDLGSSRVVTADEGIEGLSDQLEEEKRRASEAAALAAAEARRRIAAENDAAVLRRENAAKDGQIVDTGLEAIKEQRKAKRDAYKAAMESGDYDAAASINDEIADLAAEERELATAKRGMAERPKTEPARKSDDELWNAYKGQFPAKAQAWLEGHRDIVQKKGHHLAAADQDARDAGHQFESDEYFAFIEDRLLGKKETAVAKDPEPKVVPKVVPKIVPAAPVRNGGNSAPTVADGRNPMKITLTPEQIEFAKQMDLTPKQYAIQLAALMREGKIKATA